MQHLKKSLRIANAQAFWGDRSHAALELLQADQEVDYLTLDYLAEFSLSILAIQKQKDPTLGYARDFLDVAKSLIPLWKKGLKTKLICNAGGLNPEGCAAALTALFQAQGISKKIGVVSGDDITHILKQESVNPLFRNLDTGDSLETISQRLSTANAYLGSDGIVSALEQGAEIVITGRVADPSLTVAPCIFHYQWSKEEYDKLAGATVAGHLIECGTQVTGGFCTHWLEGHRHATMGYPIAEIDALGNCVITKPAKSGGWVTVETVKEQLLYEIGDPANYLSPDIRLSFQEIEVKQVGQDRVAVTGAKGFAPSPTYKVSATYFDGFRAEGTLTIVGEQAAEKAQKAGEVLLERLRLLGCQPERSLIELLGNGGSLHGVLPKPQNLLECVLRIAVADPNKDKVEAFCKELAPLITSGPQGTTGYNSGRPKPRPIYTFWPCLIEKERVPTHVTVR